MVNVIDRGKFENESRSTVQPFLHHGTVPKDLLAARIRVRVRVRVGIGLGLGLG